MISIYLINISPTDAVIGKTPYEVWNDMKPLVSHLHVFGCITRSLILAQKLHKLDEKLEKCIHIIYCTQSKVYKLYNHITQKVVVSQDVVFDESAQ